MVLHFIHEAPKYHIARIIREGNVNNYSDLGNCDAPDLIKAISEWARYMQHPSCFHVDEEGCFHSEQFKDYCGLKAIEVKMAAGEAHWQNGIVERHIGTFRELLNKLLLEDSFEGADNQTIVDSVCEAKNRNGTYNGTSPSQWLLGRNRHPLIDTSEASPMITKGSAFEEHLARRTVAAQQFHAADAKNILHMAARARSRVISEVQAGQLVYYFRRGKKKADQ